jgi:hypothetical protein
MALRWHPECSWDVADFRFFGLHAAAVVAESTVLHVFSRLSNGGPKKAVSVSWRVRLGRLLVRLMGCFWVTTFWVWVTPNAYYGRVHCVLDKVAARDMKEMKRG